jgi:outer membrane protein assembly factor BamB
MSDAAIQAHDGPPTQEPRRSDVTVPSPITTAGPGATALNLTLPAGASLTRRPRLWPGALIVLLQVLLITVPVWVAPQSISAFMIRMWAPMLATVVLGAWWLFFSRVSWRDRGLVPLAFAAVAGAMFFLCDPTLTPPPLPLPLLLYALPAVTTLAMLWLLVSLAFAWPARRAGLLLMPVLVGGFFLNLRLDGTDGSFNPEWAWRWGTTAEDRYLADLDSYKGAGEGPAVSPTADPGDWLGFRGARRDGRLTGVQIDTDWRSAPPKQVWRRRVGPGWSSFAVVGKRLYTQEQRGDFEAVLCLDADTGKEVWAHTDETRFRETVSGAGPRATPTFHGGKIYALGAKGHLNCLDAGTGQKLWARDVAQDAGAKVPIWGFASSPLVWHGVVTVFAGGTDGKSVLGYDARTGELKWSAGEGTNSYCSPQPARIGGKDQVLLTTEEGVTAFDPVKGDVLWKHDWKFEGQARVVQPAAVGDTGVLLGSGLGKGARLLRAPTGGESYAAEVWTTTAISPYYNDLVVHKGHLYGFDGSFFTCVELEAGEGRWRERGYGNGQVLLLADQDLLLILSEKGEVALREASPERRAELGKFQAIKGKTWNHPVLARGRLFVRNGVEMACYELKTK